MNIYPVIFSEPGTGEGCLAHVQADSYREAVAQCDEAAWDEGGIWDGCDFTVWPVPSN